MGYAARGAGSEPRGVDVDVEFAVAERVEIFAADREMAAPGRSCLAFAVGESQLCPRLGGA